MFDKRRFPRVEVDFEVEIFSSLKASLGKGRAVDISTSGIGVKTVQPLKINRTADSFVTLSLPDGTSLDKARVEVRGVEKYKDGYLVKLRFTEMKVIDTMREYVAKLSASKEVK